MKLYKTQELLPYILEYIEENSFSKSPINLYEPIDYIMEIGGKRLRPALVLMAYNLYKEDIKTALPAAFAIELFHNFSLVHDDIMDDAPTRRGKTTVHEKWDINTGILSGDVMLVKAYEYLLEAKKEKAYDILKSFNQAAVEVCEGQQLDVDFETREDVQIEEYIQMIHYKTASLIGAAIKIGALIGDAPLSDAEYLEQYATQVGIAFQIQDDILDTYGDPKKFGKKVGGDICQNKKTYLVLETLKSANKKDKEQLSMFLSTRFEGTEQEKVESVTAIFDKYEIKEKAATVMNQYLDNGLAALEKVSVSKERKEILEQFAHTLIKREV